MIFSSKELEVLKEEKKVILKCRRKENRHLSHPQAMSYEGSEKEIVLHSEELGDVFIKR